MHGPLAEIRALYRTRSLGDQLRMYQRWHGTPFLAVEAVVPRAGTVVDAGCGFGMFSATLALASSHRTVIGLDVDGPKIQLARSLYGSLPNVSFAEADLAHAPIPPADAVVFYDVLHHLRDAVVERVLAAAYDRLSPGGVLVVKENDTGPFGKRMVSELVEQVAVGFGITHSDPWHFRTRSEWVRTLSSAGFRVRDARPLASAGYGTLLPHSLFVAERA